jgi:outer membrane protein assembly factor BamD (BamD/ComL family)
MKKFLIITLILGLVGLASIPLWTSKVAENAFNNPHDPKSPEKVKDALLVKMRLQRFEHARRMAEKAVLFFPRCKEMPYFLYNAAKCADLERKPKVAIYWYKKFIHRYPKHVWTPQAKNALKKLVALHETP